MENHIPYFNSLSVTYVFYAFAVTGHRAVDSARKYKYKGKTLLLMDRQLEENVFGPFDYVFFI